MAATFRSSRLVYRAIEDNDQDNAFFHTLLSDSKGFGNFDPRPPQPVSRKFSSTYASLHHEKLIAVVICLPILTHSNSSNEGNREESKAESLKPIGIIGLDKIEDRSVHHRNSNLFVFIEKGEQRNGYGSEAIEWVLKWAFEMRGLHRVGIGFAGWNEDAGRLYERLGFVVEGREREALWWGGRWWDKVGLGMLEGEWRVREERRKREENR